MKTLIKTSLLIILLLVSCKKDTAKDTNNSDVIENSETTIEESDYNDEKEVVAPQEDIALKTLPTRWTLLTKHTAGDYVIFDECRFGPQALVFEENFEWFEIKGGGDAINYDITEITKNGDTITIHFSNVGEKNTLIISHLNNEKVLFTFDEKKVYYTNQTNLETFRVYKEECDD